jgi:glutaredoxin 3
MTAKKVIVYSTQMCPWCVKAKEWLKENKIKFEDVDLSKSENRERAIKLIEKTGNSGVPQIDVDGEIIVGFDVDKLKELLGIE